MNFWLVGTGGILGALLRYLLSRWIDKRQSFLSFPLATFIINFSGSFLLGWLTQSAAALWPQLGSAPMLLLGTGLCGAYTTFSTFTYETVMLIQEQQTKLAALYMSVSFLMCASAAGLGLFGIPHM